MGDAAFTGCIPALMTPCTARGEPDYDLLVETASWLAQELDEALAVLASFDEGPDLVLYYKHLMTVEGHAGYARHFNASDVLSESQRRYAEAQLALFKAWHADWMKDPDAARLCA